MGQIVLGDHDACFQKLAARRTLLGRQAHVRLAAVGTPDDQFRRRVAMNGIVQRVLHLIKKGLAGRCIPVVVHRRGVNIRDLLVKPASEHPNLATLGQQALEIVLAQSAIIFPALAVQHIVLDGKLGQGLRGPLLSPRFLPKRAARHAGGARPLLDIPAWKDNDRTHDEFSPSAFQKQSRQPSRLGLGSLAGSSPLHARHSRASHPRMRTPAR